MLPTFPKAQTALAEMTRPNFDDGGNPAVQLVCGTEFAEELKKHEAEWREDKAFA